jgi:ubiquilin
MEITTTTNMQQEECSTLLNVKLKTLNGCNYEFSVPPSLSVLQFKELISGRTQIPIDSQKLIYMGRVLKDCQTIESCGT